MNMTNWFEARMHNLKWYDISLTKMSTLFFTLMLAKLWEPILSLDWQIYLALSLIFATRPIYQFYFRGQTHRRSALAR